MRILIAILLCTVFFSCNNKDDQIKQLTRELKDQEAKLQMQKSSLDSLAKLKDGELKKAKDDYDKAVEEYNKNGKYPGKYPFTSSKEIKDEDLKGLSDNELKIMKNEILARHGFIFSDKEMKDHFSKLKWYSAKNQNVDKLLTPLEKQNIQNIEAFEKMKK
ncbi:MAG: YARHG domain-containing protein [Ignavibacteriae bacterium]|nr:YARHG domain-containing protein [Ignavibacteriota bacterium]